MPAIRSDLADNLPVVYCGRAVEEWYSMYCQAVLRLDKAEKLLRRAYNGMHKDHWAEGESETEVCKAISDHFANVKA
jgi:hypothetical protein